MYLLIVWAKCISVLPVFYRWKERAGDGWIVRRRCLEGWSPALWTCPRCSVASQSSERSWCFCPKLLSRPMSHAHRWIPTENTKYCTAYCLTITAKLLLLIHDFSSLYLTLRLHTIHSSSYYNLICLSFIFATAAKRFHPFEIWW